MFAALTYTLLSYIHYWSFAHFKGDPDKSGFDAGMGIGLSAPSISVPRLGDQPQEQQAEHESRQLTRFEQGIVKKAIEKLEKIFKEEMNHITPRNQPRLKLATKVIEDIFKKADSQGRAAAYNLLGLPFEIQVEILNSLTPPERSDIAKISKSHEELIERYNNQRIEHIARMQTELRYLKPLTVESITKLGKAFPNIKKLTLSTLGVNLRTSEAIMSAFPQLEFIILLDCSLDRYLVEIIFDKWKKDKPGRAVTCIPANNPRPTLVYLDWWGGDT
jgi:hypothetical protein